MKSFTSTDPVSHEGQTNSWLTPPWVFSSLGNFTLDPCGFKGHDTAQVVWHPPIDGLERDWFGRVWLNPPYGRNLSKWLDRMQDHESGIALVFARTDTKWFHELWCDKFFIEGRIKFWREDFTEATNAGVGSMLLAWSEEDCQIISKSGIKGSWI